MNTKALEPMSKLLTIITCLIAFNIFANQDPKVEKALTRHLNEPQQNYEISYFDFNNDGVDDAFVYMNNRNWCGSGGCTSFVFQGEKGEFKFLSKIMITKKPILVSKNTSNGFHDLIVTTGGVGRVVLAFDGVKYPLNPSLQPKVNNQQLVNGTVILE
ncbi:hypothetical protein N7931_10150 [Catenovulum sp. 2E275]|uniref:hypothetical protein n=1 Tax=Catenovulum sp. 2E275 TaxID=2980497 RepID=UPI0021CEFACF|nr:hypothetical protein [Catenovulum sp. 2E275]MCU4675996.1 hypothetical protein [Catenovulum sp. 2E275]